jgi:hypothetical protein
MFSRLIRLLVVVAALASPASAQVPSWVVKDRSLATPPGSPSQGDRYIVAASPTGAWSGHTNDIAVRQGSAWKFITAQAGLSAWVEDEPAKVIYFNGTSWGDVPTSVSVNPAVSNLLVGNESVPTRSALISRGTTAFTSEREVQAAFGLVSNRGAAQSPSYLGDKVTVYAGIQSDAGTGNTWAFNFLNYLPETLGATSQTFQVGELDMQNNSQNFGVGEIIGPSAASVGLSITASTATSLNGGNAYKNNAALWITGRPGVWNYGIVFTAAAINQATIYEASALTSTWGMVLAGTHTWGIDFTGTASSAAIRCANNMSCIGAQNAAGNATLALLKLDASNQLIIGAGIAANTLFGNSAGGNNFQVSSPGGATINRWYTQGALTTATPVLGTVGTDTNVSGLLQMQGTGSLFVKNTNGNYLQAADGFLDLLKTGSVLKIAGTQVVGPRNTGWTAMTGTTDKATAYDTATVTLPQLAGRVMALQAALTTHGLIGP